MPDKKKRMPAYEYARYKKALTLRLEAEHKRMLVELAEESKIPYSKLLRSILEGAIERRYKKMIDPDSTSEPSEDEAS